MGSIIRSMGNFFSTIVQRFLPDAFIFCLLLTFVAMLGGVVLGGKTPLEIFGYWGNGFWGMLTFSMQSSMALMTGYALSSAPLFRRGLSKVASLPKNFGQAVLLASAGSFIIWYIHWGVGAVATGLLCVEITRQMAKKGVKIHYPLLVAASYLGSGTWHAGISGASQLLVATENHFLVDLIGVIPVSQTIFHPMNIVISLLQLIIIPIVTYFMIPDEKDFKQPPERVLKSLEENDAVKESGAIGEKRSIAGVLNNSVIVSMLTGAIGLVFLYLWFAKWGGAFDLNIFIVIMLILAIVLHYRPANFFRCMKDGARAAAPIFLQFQFYGGIMGIMVSSGLIAIIANWFVNIATAYTFPWLSYIAAGVVNMFVPSGGGQWTVQGEIVMRAALDLGASIPKSIDAFAYGDGWTNLIQPFWALPLLGFAGLGIRDIMGYSTVVFLFVFLINSIGLLLLPW
ncbi:MAG: short-chain fatty acid transporter [Bacillota bacterium]|jgi:short-chain fatty acids transporter